MTKIRRVNVRGIILKDGQIFVQTIKQPDGGESAHWCTPGGGLESGESLHAGLYRELMEETGVAPQIGKLLFMQQFHDGAKEHLEFFFHVQNAVDYEVIDLAQTSHGDIEIARYGFVPPAEVHVLPQFLQEVDIAAHIEDQQPVRIYDLLNE